MVVIKRIDPMSLAKIYAVIMAVFGFVMGVVFFISMAFVGPSLSTPVYFAGAGIFMIVFFPIFYGILGFIAGAIGAVLYNFVASKIGGVKVEFGAIR